MADPTEVDICRKKARRCRQFERQRRAMQFRGLLDDEVGFESHRMGQVVEIGRGRHHRLVNLGKLLFSPGTWCSFSTVMIYSSLNRPLRIRPSPLDGS